MDRCKSPASDASDVVAGRETIQEYRDALARLEAKEHVAKMIEEDEQPRSPCSTPPRQAEPEVELTAPPRPTPKKRVQQCIQWSGTEAINQQFFAAIGREVALDRLGFDVKQEFGQSRTLDACAEGH